MTSNQDFHDFTRINFKGRFPINFVPKRFNPHLYNTTIDKSSNTISIDNFCCALFRYSYDGLLERFKFEIFSPNYHGRLGHNGRVEYILNFVISGYGKFTFEGYPEYEKSFELILDSGNPDKAMPICDVYTIFDYSGLLTKASR